MKIAVTGSEGRLGKVLVGMGCVHTILKSDVTKRDELIDEMSSARPDIVIHLAAMTDVDWCEKNPKEAQRVNFRGATNTAEACEKSGANMVFLSSDHVFEGRWGRYTENEKRNPKNVYGLTKLAAEVGLQAFDCAKIVRTSKNFGPHELDAKFIPGWADFPTFIHRSFIYSKDFIYSLLNYVSRFDEMPKVLHLASREAISWYDFALLYAEYHHMFRDEVKNHVIARRNDDTTYAPRPFHGGLHVGKALSLGFKLPSIRQSLKNSIKDEKE